jgi:hypothetical protein
LYQALDKGTGTAQEAITLAEIAAAVAPQFQLSPPVHISKDLLSNVGVRTALQFCRDFQSLRTYVAAENSGGRDVRLSCHCAPRRCHTEGLAKQFLPRGVKALRQPTGAAAANSQHHPRSDSCCKKDLSPWCNTDPHGKTGYKQDHDLTQPDVHAVHLNTAADPEAENVDWVATPCTSFCDWSLANGGNAGTSSTWTQHAASALSDPGTEEARGTESIGNTQPQHTTNGERSNENAHLVLPPERVSTAETNRFELITRQRCTSACQYLYVARGSRLEQICGDRCCMTMHHEGPTTVAAYTKPLPAGAPVRLLTVKAT